MEKTILGSGQELVNEAIRVQTEFKKTNIIWSLEMCLQQVVDNETISTNKLAITTAKIVAKSIDKNYHLTFL